MKKSILFFSVSFLVHNINTGAPFNRVAAEIKARQDEQAAAAKKHADEVAEEAQRKADLNAMKSAFANDFNPLSVEARRRVSQETNLSESVIDAMYFAFEAGFQYLMNGNGFMPGLSLEEEENIKAAFTKARSSNNDQAMIDATVDGFVMLYKTFTRKTRPKIEATVKRRNATKQSSQRRQR